MHRRIAAGGVTSLAVALSFVVATCRLFELGDVVPAPDAAGGGDGARDGGPCDAADPCSCLTPATTISPGPRGVGDAIALAGGSVYFMVSFMPSSPVIFRAPVDGVDVAAPVQVMRPSPVAGSMIIAGSSILMRRVGSAYSVMRVPLDAVDQPAVALREKLTFPATDLAADTQRVYWPNTSGAICAARLDGTGPAPDTLDSGCAGAPVVAPRDAGSTSYSEIVVSGGALFWTINASKIDTAPADVGTPVRQIIFQTGGNLTGLRENAGQLLWVRVSPEAGSLWTADSNGSGQSVLVPSLIDNRAVAPTYAVDADGIYWGQREWNRLMAVARDGSGRRLVACEAEDGIAGITTDASFIYWVTSNGAVRRIAKK